MEEKQEQLSRQFLKTAAGHCPHAKWLGPPPGASSRVSSTGTVWGTAWQKESPKKGLAAVATCRIVQLPVNLGVDTSDTRRVMKESARIEVPPPSLTLPSHHMLGYAKLVRRIEKHRLRGVPS